MIVLGLGSNLGERLQNLQRAIELLNYPVKNKSSVYETQPVDYTDQPCFLNAVVEIETQDAPRAVLDRCRKVEDTLGRQRIIEKGPRTVDIDVLFYHNLILDTEDLVLPHPRVAHRRFVLVPLHEIAPHYIHPVFGRSIEDLLRFCPDNSEVRLIESLW